MGDTVRCPWHHACFSLRTGEALRPPALNDLPCWDVEQRGGRVFVGGEAARRRARATPRRRVPGARGDRRRRRGRQRAAETLRREGYAGPVTVVDPDADAPYDRPNLSKDYLAGTAPEEWIPLHPPEFYRDRGHRAAPRRAGRARSTRRAAAYDLKDGTDLPYGALLLATGATPVRLDPALEARHAARALPADRWPTAARSWRAAREGGRAVVLGASFIGLEVAASLRARKMEVHVVAPDARPLGAGAWAPSSAI